MAAATSKRASIHRALSVREDAFCLAYAAGPDGVIGQAVPAYLVAYGSTVSRKSAQQGSNRLLKRERVGVRIRELRSEAQRTAKARLRDWWELAPEAQAVVERATRGDWPNGYTDEQIRTAFKAAMHILDRCEGTVQQMHSVKHEGAGLQVVVGVVGVNGAGVEP